MYSRPTAPASIGGVLDNIFKLYAAALPQCWPISLTSALVALIPGIYIALKVGSDPAQVLGMFASPTFWGSYLVLIAISLIFSFAMLIRVAQVAQGEEGSTSGAIMRAGTLLPRAFGATLLFLLAYLVGVILLIVPGIIWSVSFILAGAFIVVEDVGAVESLSRSRRLVKGNWWRTFGILTIALIMAYVLLVTVQFASSFGARLLSADPVVAIIVTTVLGGLLNVVISPLYSASILGIYFDLKLRKEGDDLSARVASLDQAPAKV